MAANEEGVGAKVLDRIKVVLAQAQQGQVGLEDVAVGNPRADWRGRINQRVDLDGLEILANKCQSCVGTEVVGQLFNNEVGHIRSNLQGEQHFKPKSLIYINKTGFITTKSRIQEKVNFHKK